MNKKPILCLDFDGVCHSYTSGWQGADVISDPPVPGLFEFLEEALEEFEIYIYSSRSHQPGGISAMMKWLYYHYKQWQSETRKMLQMDDVKFPVYKPPAFLTIDDRAMTFTGQWPTTRELQKFQPWYKKGGE